MKKIGIFASGTGSNAFKIIKHFEGNDNVEFVVLSNNKDAGVLEKAASLGIPHYSFLKKEFSDGTVLNFLKENNVDLIILAGFLLLVSEDIINHYPNKVINIHPALLPKYGGKGMYGINVHRAVVENKEAISGITIHYCNNEYDEGQFILQATTQLDPADTPEEVAAKVLKLEHFYFPRVVENILAQ
ncbi:phosphoribosylglycinamide formyltransferase [Flammeovirga aprica]|uniref:Phosphoribosylglycinamide formyltransferase n=1 Tax=Flammeovirga aprica JL-4 TaxID=694437 RepID=A0A7X9RZ63_9BACT|nr:phosphoribosylglycinamide formyltransferase [Flammeovirga aprica]NME71389.1 phosphoribosylglycinamide formyltransferase [Flammeovirga aprica JL-4]